MIHGLLRLAAVGNHFMILVSSIIVTGLVSRFFARSSFRNAHTTYIEVIAVITLFFYLIGMFLPLIRRYRGHLMPVNLVFSYLWLTSFVFAAQDWSSGRCHHRRPFFASCARKHTIEAFTFIAFFFLLCNVIVEGLLWRAHHKDREQEASGGHTKERPASRSTTDAGDRESHV